MSPIRIRLPHEHVLPYFDRIRFTIFMVLILLCRSRLALLFSKVLHQAGIGRLAAGHALKGFHCITKMGRGNSVFLDAFASRLVAGAVC